MDENEQKRLDDIGFAGSTYRTFDKGKSAEELGYKEGSPEWGRWWMGYLLGRRGTLGDLEKARVVADKCGFAHPSWATSTLAVGFTLSREQEYEIRVKCLHAGMEISGGTDIRGLMPWDSPQMFARTGRISIVDDKSRIVKVTLDDITPTDVEFSQGDDPGLSRDDNCLEKVRHIRRLTDDDKALVNYETSTSSRHGLFSTYEEQKAHFTKLMGILEDVYDNVGYQPQRHYDQPDKKPGFVMTNEIVVGDTVRWREIDSYYENGKPRTWRQMTADVVSEGFYDSDGSREMIPYEFQATRPGQGWATRLTRQRKFQPTIPPSRNAGW